ncbi:Hypothetical protein Mbur_0642 [Methanococcoides burtonii DSM 6242]|uniref:Uncharacterized protein n=1 Tax=Methanococcoides burtonii (strain DSM 6242 / NBRC 107633 / OCM 468 / ACE-M) TaxID=259564 RepID=Q12Y63_METBU|nr:Hypothetical protein Mbur_0642 [Methanococcoides burtonii DSM 6242]
MNSKIDYQSTTRFLMSMGLVLCITGALLFAFLLTIPSSTMVLFLFIFIVVFIFIGFILLYKGFNDLRLSEVQEKGNVLS